MSQLLETLRLSNRKFQNIFYHNQRLNRARKELFGCTDVIDIATEVSIPADLGDSTYKCSILYSTSIEKVNFEVYKRREIKSLKVVHDDTIDYYYKYADRSSLNKLLEQKGSCDEIVIIKNGLLTDTSYTNLAFFNGSEWHTPSIPLLKGTMREQLLGEKLIREKEIRFTDLHLYQKVSLINCMLHLDALALPISHIIT
jgi:4-amino-4-deoxychorismate lyase